MERELKSVPGLIKSFLHGRIHVLEDVSSPVVKDSPDQQVREVTLVLGKFFHKLSETEFIGVVLID